MARPTNIGAGRLLLVGVVAIGGLLAVRDRLDGPPPPVSLDAAARWLEPHDPLAVATMLVWLLALVAAAYLTVVAGLVLVGSATGRVAPGRWADRLSLPLVRRLTGRAVGVGLTASVVVAASPVAAGPTDPPPPTGPTTSPSPWCCSTVEPPPTAGGSVATMRRLNDDETITDTDVTTSDEDASSSTVGAPATTTPSSAPRAAPTPTTRPDAPVESAPPPTADDRQPPASTPDPATTEAAPVPATETWTIAPGEHLWRVAAETLADHGRAVDDRATLTYLHRLIEANRDRLVDPANPDLVHPGQVMVLPPIDG